MGKVKMDDLHRLLDLVDEASAKTDLWLCLSIDSFGKERGHISIDFAVFNKSIENKKPEMVFDAMFQIGKVAFEHEGYKKAKEYLINLIKEADGND